MRYEVLAGDAVIGWSEFEYGDPPMGVVHGRFHPNGHYRSSRHARPEAGLRTRPEGLAEFFTPEGGVFIEDRSNDLDPNDVEVSVLGLDPATYERFFAHHMSTCDDSFRPR